MKVIDEHFSKNIVQTYSVFPNQSQKSGEISFIKERDNGKLIYLKRINSFTGKEIKSNIQNELFHNPIIEERYADYIISWPNVDEEFIEKHSEPINNVKDFLQKEQIE